MTGFRPWPVSSAQVRHRPNRMPKHRRKCRKINAKSQRCRDARICAKRMECVQLAGAVARRGAVRKREQAPRTPNDSRSSVAALLRDVNCGFRDESPPTAQAHEPAGLRRARSRSWPKCLAVNGRCLPRTAGSSSSASSRESSSAGSSFVRKSRKASRTTSPGLA